MSYLQGILGSNGIVMTVDENGNKTPLKIGDSILQVKDAVEGIVQNRLKAEKDAYETSISQMKDEMKKLQVDSTEYIKLKNNVEILQGKLDDAESQAAEKVQQQMTDLSNENETLKTQVSQLQADITKRDVESLIIEHAGNFFRHSDVVQELMPKLHTEKDKDGKNVHTFKMNVKDEKGEVKEQFLTPEQAVEAVGAERPYLLKGSDRSGLNTGDPNDLKQKSKLSAREKVTEKIRQNL